MNKIQFKKIFLVLPLASIILLTSGVSASETDPLNDGIESDLYEPIFYISEYEENPENQSNITSLVNENSGVNVVLDGGATYYFTNCGKTGTDGPSQSSINNSYAGTSLANSVTSLSGMQVWEVPYTGTYFFEVKGAMGGSQNSTYRGGYGAVVC